MPPNTFVEDIVTFRMLLEFAELIYRVEFEGSRILTAIFDVASLKH